MTLQESQLESREQVPVSGEPIGKVVAGQSPTQLAMGRFRKDKLSMVSFVIVVFFIVAAIAAPILVKLGVIDYLTFHPHLLDLENGTGLPKGHFSGASMSHPFGVEPATGRDVLSRLWYGVTFSMTIALSATVVSTVIGTVLGIIGGFTGGYVDTAVGRFVDLTLCFPQTLMLLALSAPLVVAMHEKLHLPTNFANGLYVILVLGLFGWPSVARLVRGQVLSIREREFIDAARLLGSSRSRLYFKEILPNLWAPLLVVSTLTMPAYVSAEAALSFLGVGVQAPTPTLGNVLTGSINYAEGDFFFFFFPALVIALIVVSFNLLGDGIRDALDPRSDR
jgi:peptide/nickel transport system permease protein